tara:strand:- start:4996 stop:5310 length:315 start_codon:yes stop_codon:yes gene_type:complete
MTTHDHTLDITLQKLTYRSAEVYAVGHGIEGKFCLSLDPVYENASTEKWDVHAIDNDGEPTGSKPDEDALNFVSSSAETYVESRWRDALHNMEFAEDDFNMENE